jgi:hypothetical protein
MVILFIFCVNSYYFPAICRHFVLNFFCAGTALGYYSNGADPVGLMPCHYFLRLTPLQFRKSTLLSFKSFESPRSCAAVQLNKCAPFSLFCAGFPLVLPCSFPFEHCACGFIFVSGSRPVFPNKRALAFAGECVAVQSWHLD